ncbi:ATP-binding protein [Enterococcus rotai]|uniref:ATP-binding protein n=1 Tax=Enterococcus rotai TaxID=118060 RepID=UPI0032B3F05B
MDFPLLNEVQETSELCEIHGVAKVKLKDFEPFCLECQKEKRDQKEQERVKDMFERNYRRKTIETLKLDSIVGDIKLWDADFKNYIPDNNESETALAAARKFAYEYLDREKKFNTIFSGVPGVGKSHLAMSMLKAINEHFDPYGSCLFVSVNDLMRLIKDSINNRESKYTEVNMVHLLSKVDVLVLDDLGSESSFKRDSREASEYIQQVLFGVLNARQRTIITTNLSSSELEEIYNPKIVSRIYKGVENHIIKFTEATKDKRSKIVF